MTKMLDLSSAETEEIDSFNEKLLVQELRAQHVQRFRLVFLGRPLGG